MARSQWFDARTRIPFAGIVAIVLIVAVVAIFLRSSIERFVPDSEIRVSAEGDIDNVRGSASFVGERDIPLAYRERLQGLLTNNKGSLSFLVDVSERVMYIDAAGREEVLLMPTEDGLGLMAEFEHDGSPATVVIYPSERELRWRLGNGFPVIVSLSETVTYEGVFLFSGTRHTLTFHPASSSVTIVSDNRRATVSLVRTGAVYTGTWHERGNSHPVMVDMSRLLAVIGELW